jgi:hypothetical protein
MQSKTPDPFEVSPDPFEASSPFHPSIYVPVSSFERGARSEIEDSVLGILLSIIRKGNTI